MGTLQRENSAEQEYCSRELACLYRGAVRKLSNLCVPGRGGDAIVRAWGERR